MAHRPGADRAGAIPYTSKFGRGRSAAPGS